RQVRIWDEARGSGKRKTGEDFNKWDLEKVRLGEIKHHLFQAGCRGAVRTAIGDSCPPDCHLYIIYWSRELPSDTLLEVFPGATIEEWKPVIRLGKTKQKLADFLEAIATEEGVVIQKSDT